MGRQPARADLAPVDRLTDGITARDCAAVSANLSPVLDSEDPIDHSYRLEVSSPGIARPVQRPADFKRFEGYRIKIKLVEGPPRRRYTGVLADATDAEFSVIIDGESHRIATDTVESAHLVLDLHEYEQLMLGSQQ